jgi:DNA helicase IV
MDLTPAVVEFKACLLARLLQRATFRSIILGADGVSCRGGKRDRRRDRCRGQEPDRAVSCAGFSYGEIAPAETRRGLPWGSVVLSNACGRRFVATGLRNRDVVRLAAALSGRAMIHASRDHLESLVAWVRSHADLVSGARFISRWEHERWMETWAAAAAWEEHHRAELQECFPGFAAALRDTAHFRANHDREVERANDAFVRAEVEKQAALFDDVNGASLTAQQREIAVRNDTDVLVIAGAGTGKTQAIAGKVAYLVRSGRARPEEILIVAFNTKAAEELRDRAGKAGGPGIQARTFHSLGNQILGSPPLLNEAQDEAGMLALMQGLVEPLRRDREYESTLAELVLLYREPLFPTVSCGDFKEYVRTVKASSLRALKGGHRVKNSEELRIANWLFLHGVEYDYERLYPQSITGGAEIGSPAAATPGAPPTARSEKRSAAPRPYKPTFHLPQWDLWLSHHPLDRHGQPPAWYPDGAQCVEEIARGRALHLAHGTRFVESSSWWFVENGWELRLRELLEGAGAVIPTLDWSEALERPGGQDPPQGLPVAADQALRWFHQSASRYIQLLSEGGHDPETVFGAPERPPDPRRIALFKQVCRPVWRAYQETKSERALIDFSDMIRLSREALAGGKWHRRFTHIIVDEYQDVSTSKMELLAALRDLTPGSSLTCVGDDWQAINRFAGGDLGLMTGFEAHVGGKPWETRLDSTFRFDQAIAEVSGWFVQNNPMQIRKNLSSRLAVAGAEVVSMHVPHADSDDLGPAMAALDEIAGRAAPGATVCILARYRRLLGDIKETAAALGKRYPGLKISLSTVHKYKGKEADWVVVGWLTDERTGFPCLRHDDPIMAELLPESERFPFAEERRLFYVALTRARRSVYLVCDQKKPSPFVLEIEREWARRGRIRIVNLGRAPNLPCPSCRDGALVPRSGPRGLFYSCQNSPACAYKEPSCPSCGVGMMVPAGDTLTCSDESCGHRVRKCPECGTGRLVKRRNSSTGEWFLGCTRFADPQANCRFTTPE